MVGRGALGRFHHRHHYNTTDPLTPAVGVKYIEKKGTTTSFSPLYTLAIKTQVCSSSISGAHHSQQRKADTKSLVGRSLTASTVKHTAETTAQGTEHSTMTTQITDRCCAAEEKRRRKNVRPLCLAAANKKDEEAPDFD